MHMGWGQAGPKAVASRIPSHVGAFTGARQRRSPVGGRA